MGEDVRCRGHLSRVQQPIISVVMPCYNGARYLAAAAGSALGQTYGNVELVLIDDGSTDASHGIQAELERAYGERVILLRTSHAGPYPARNAGLRRARGELIAFLDSDDWWEPTALATLHAAL